MSLHNEGVEAFSASVTFYFREEPAPVPDFLIGRRGKSPKRANYGFHLFLQEADWDLRSRGLVEFLDASLSVAASNGVDSEWLKERNCKLRVYISLHPGEDSGDICIPPSTLQLMAQTGAELRVDSL